MKSILKKTILATNSRGLLINSCKSAKSVAKNNLFSVLVFISFFIIACQNAIPVNQISIPTESNSFAIAEIPKPTYTSTSTIIPSPTVTLTPTPEPIAQAEIVIDTPTSAYFAPSVSQIDNAPVIYTGGKYILVDISEQHMYVYQGDTVVYSFVSSTGMSNATRVGNFSVLNKIPNAYGATWNIWMPNWLGIYWAGSLQNGIHALPILPSGAQLWAGYLGVPISYGCVVLGAYESQLLYNWADVGTPVEIQW